MEWNMSMPELISKENTHVFAK